MSCDLTPMGEVILHMPSTDNDSFAKKLEFEVLESRFGYSRVKGRVKPEFLNGLGIRPLPFRARRSTGRAAAPGRPRLA